MVANRTPSGVTAQLTIMNERRLSDKDIDRLLLEAERHGTQNPEDLGLAHQKHAQPAQDEVLSSIQAFIAGIRITFGREWARE
jgi:hypothetical protein